MTAIITDKIKRQFIQKLFNEAEGTSLGDSDNYFYIGVGRSQQWQPVLNTDTTPIPANTEREERTFRYNLQAIKAIEAFSYVVPLKDWISNTTYAAYNDNIVGQPDQSYYVRTNDNHVYVCIRQGKNAAGSANVSQFQPSHTDTTLPIQDDGYIWKYMYTISTADANSFLTSNFMPVKFIDSAAVTDPYYGQYAIQNAAVPGQIIGYRVVSAGGTYSAPPALTVVGSGSGASAYAVLDATGSVSAVEVGDSDGVTNITNFLGTGYNQASVRVSDASLVSGVTAEIAPIFAQKLGLGHDAIVDLRSTSIMYNIKPEASVDGKWIVNNDYRQIGLFKNITIFDSDAKFTETAGTGLKKVVLTTPVTGGLSWNTDTKLIGDSNAKGWIDYWDDSATFWYHQDDQTGFVPFRDGEAVTIQNKAGSFTIAERVNPDIDIYSGDLLFINNTSFITRDELLTEDIKIVIKL